MLFYLLALSLAALDQIIKNYFSGLLSAGQSLPLIKNIFHLTLVKNSGAAFGILPNQRPFLIVIGLLVLGLILYFIKKTPKSDYLMLSSLSLILGGSLSNLYDRIVRGYVIDFIDFRVWPVFNFSDVMIDAGIGLIVLHYLINRKK
jgi:signal peptidase II